MAGIMMKGAEQSLSILLWIIVFVLTLIAVYAMKIGIDVVAEQEVTYSFTEFARALDIMCSKGIRADELNYYFDLTHKPLVGEASGNIRPENDPVLPPDYYICWNCEELLKKYESAGIKPALSKAVCDDQLCLVKYGLVLKSYPMRSCSFFEKVETKLYFGDKGNVEKTQGILITYDGYTHEEIIIDISEEDDKKTLLFSVWEWLK